MMEGLRAADGVGIEYGIGPSDAKGMKTPCRFRSGGTLELIRRYHQNRRWRGRGGPVVLRRADPGKACMSASAAAHVWPRTCARKDGYGGFDCRTPYVATSVPGRTGCGVRTVVFEEKVRVCHCALGASAGSLMLRAARRAGRHRLHYADMCRYT